MYEEMWDVYLRGHRYVAEPWHGPEQHVTGAKSRAHAIHLAQLFQEEIDEMAKRSGSTKEKPSGSAAVKRVKDDPSLSKRLLDPRLPKVGEDFTKEYKGEKHKVRRTEAGLVWNGKTYGSISGLAAEMTGRKVIDGFAFFRKELGLDQKAASTRKPRPVAKKK